MRRVHAAALLLALALTGCVGDPSPETADQRDCRTADEILPTLREAQDGSLSADEVAQAERDLRELINDRLVSSDGQVAAMMYVLGAPVWSDPAGLDGTDETFDDFHRQLVEYCEDFAGWPMTH